MARLPELPENNTARVFIRYTSFGVQHEAILRLPSGAGQAEAIAQYNTFRPLIAAILPTTDSVLGARFQAQGALVSFPLTVTAEAGQLTMPIVPGNKPEFISFTGRSQDGRRVRFTVFTPAQSPDQGDYRQETQGAAYSAIRDALVAAGGAIVTKSGQTPVWNSYMNNGYNAYWQRKIRRTG